tara:strand:- start:698 stop:2107 length:1410 start_codon:yes stop_codon:yes gene_type:complete
MISKHSQTKYFILDPSAVDPAAASTLYNLAGALNLNVGSLGLYGPTPGSGNHVVTASPGAAFQIIQRRNTSNDKSPLYSRPFEQSDWINAQCSEGLILDQQNGALGTNDSHLIGNSIVATSAIQPVDLTTYQIQVSGHGARTDWFNGGYNTPTIFGFYTTPDFSLGTLSIPQQRDTIVAELALAVNDNKSQQMAFAIALGVGAAGTGVLNIDDLGNSPGAGAPVAVGTNVVLGYDRLGNQHSFVLTVEMQRSFALLELDLIAKGLGAGTGQLIPYAATGSSNLPAGVVLAGTTNVCTMLFMMAVDSGQASFDYKAQTKRRIEVGLVSGLDNVPQERISIASEGQGYARQLSIQYQMNNRYEETNSSRMPYESYHVEFPSTFRADAFYDYFIIEHCDGRTASSGMPSVNRFTTIIAVVNTTIGSLTTNPYFTTTPFAANAVLQRATLVASLNLFNTNNSLNATASGAPLA